ncbi:MAG: lytic transglycosylase domain-containing protein [Candidatus Margulisbacteria bacterium]|nr:lytic transglycosylase domain-containing protein [Candidatus Margulisiibacteriota bacterium]
MVFFTNLSIKPAPAAAKKASPLTPSVRAQVDTSVQPASAVTYQAPVPVATASAPQPAAAPVIPAGVQADHSPPAYQYLDYDRMEAVIRRYNKDLSQSDANQIKMAVNLYSKEKDIDPRLILALMARESGFNPNAVSSSGAIGLGQIMPFNYTELGISNPGDINQNVKGTIYYLKQKMDDWAGDSNQLDLSLASYLKGSGDIRRANGQFDEHTRTYIEDILKIRASI